MLLFRSSAMALVMALFAFSLVFFLGAVNPYLASFGMAILAGALVIWVAGQIRREKNNWSWSAMDIATGLFVAYSLFRYKTTSPEYEARLELIQIVCCGIACFLSSKAIRDRDARRLIVLMVGAFALFQSGIGIWQAFTKSDYIFSWERPELYNGRGSGTFVCPNHLAGFLEMSLGLIVARAAIARKEAGTIERSILVKVLLVYVAIMVALGIVTSLSRAGWLSAAFGMVTVLLMGGWRGRQIWLRLVVVVAVFACAAAVFWNLEPIRNYFLKTVVPGDGNQTVSLRDPTLGGRTMMWSGTIDMIRQNPLIGTGMGTWQWHFQKVKDYRILSFPDYTHNDYLNLASDYGIIGVVLMCLVFAAFFRHAFSVIESAQSSEDKAFAVGSVSAVVAILVHSWFDFNLHIFGNSAFLAIIMGTAAGIPLSGSPPRSTPFGQRAVAVGVVLSLLVFVTYLFVPTFRAFQVTRSGDAEKYDLNYEEAVELYVGANRIDPRYPKPSIKRGDIFRDQLAWRVGPGKLRERRDLATKAVQAYDEALRLNPYMSDVWVSRGRVQEMIGNNDEALSSYLKAIDVAPVSAYAHFVLGQFYRERGESQKAVEAFDKADRYFLYNDPMFQMSQWYEKEKLKSAPQK
jgi:O-antigen ligase